jgi:hypothetical protein
MMEMENVLNVQMTIARSVIVLEKVVALNVFLRIYLIINVLIVALLLHLLLIRCVGIVLEHAKLVSMISNVLPVLILLL